MEITQLDDREYLAAIVRHVIEVEVMYDDGDWHRVADAILAAGYRRGVTD